MRHGKSVLIFLIAFYFVGGAPVWARYQPPPACKNAFTQEQEIAEGRKVAAAVFKEIPVLPDSSPISQYVRSLGARLVEYAPGYRWPFDFHVVASEEINAFALPGGSIFVNLGTIRAAETEAQLAGVMAHETSHVVMRHSTCNITKQQAPKTGFGIASVISSVLLGDSILGSMAQAGIGLGANLTFTRMSRDYEKQADLLGTDILYDAGYDPRGMPQFFETIQAKYGEGGAQMLSDHPNPGNRMQYVNAKIATLPRQQNPKVTSAEFTRIHALAMKEPVYTAKEVGTGAWRQMGHYAAVAGGPGQVIPGLGGQRLTRGAMGLNDRLAVYQGRGFAVSYPESWQKSAGQGAGVAFAPKNGAGEAGISYGIVVDGTRWRGGVKNANDLTRATNALAQQLVQNNSGLQQVTQLTSINVGGQSANSVELRGRSPLSDGGTPVAERDWVVTVVRPDGDINYLIFIAPEPDFETLRPLFQSVLQSFQVQ
jgi:Zn-dependent protease with chaperone function